MNSRMQWQRRIIAACLLFVCLGIFSILSQVTIQSASSNAAALEHKIYLPLTANQGVLGEAALNGPAISPAVLPMGRAMTPIDDLQGIPLEQDVLTWDGYEENVPLWLIDDYAPAGAIGEALRCGLTGGEPYSNIHCFRNMGPTVNNMFTMTMRFWYSPTIVPDVTPINEVVQGLEFTMNKWEDGRRYEVALQWRNIPGPDRLWRYWDPYQPDPEPWRSLDYTQELAIGQWHTLTMRGDFHNDYTWYEDFTVNGQTFPVNLAVPTVEYGWPDFTAVAVQADGNYVNDAYDLVVDELYVDMGTRPTPDDILIDGSFDEWFDGDGNETCLVAAKPANNPIRTCVAHNDAYMLYMSHGYKIATQAKGKALCTLIDTDGDAKNNYALCSRSVNGETRVDLIRCSGNSTGTRCRKSEWVETLPETVWREATVDGLEMSRKPFHMVEAGVPWASLGIDDMSQLSTQVKIFSADFGLPTP